MEMIPKNKLDLTLWVLERMQDVQQTSSRMLRGVLDKKVDWESVERALDEKGLLGLDNNAKTRRIEIGLPSNYFNDWQSFLESSDRRTRVFKRFYIKDVGKVYPDGATGKGGPWKGYYDAVHLFEALRSLADDDRNVGNDILLVWLGARKLEVDTAYALEDLRALPKLEQFVTEFVNSDEHPDQKRGVVRNVLMQMFAGSDRVHLADVLARFDVLADRVRAGYDLYVSEFSYQKVMGEVQRQKLDFTAQINGVLADIQNQLLAVPVAVILVGGQMKPAGQLVLSNFLIWSGAAVFTLFVAFMIFNQQHTLKTVKAEINRQWDLITDEHRSIANQFRPVYCGLKKRCCWQSWLLTIILVIVLVAFGFSTWLLWHYSSDAFVQTVGFLRMLRL